MIFGMIREDKLLCNINLGGTKRNEPFTESGSRGIRGDSS